MNYFKHKDWEYERNKPLEFWEIVSGIGIVAVGLVSFYLFAVSIFSL